MNTSSIGSTLSSGQGSQSDVLRGLNMDEFLKLMITELQNQDPLNPMENTDILQQISQIREIGVTGQLSDTLGAVLSGQNLASASALLGKQVRGLTDGGENVTGVVERVTIVDGVPRLHIGEHEIKLTNVAEVLGTAETT